VAAGILLLVPEGLEDIYKRRMTTIRFVGIVKFFEPREKRAFLGALLQLFWFKCAQERPVKFD
jgi:hypothetical protein